MMKVSIRTYTRRIDRFHRVNFFSIKYCIRVDDGHQNTLGVKTFVKDKAIEMYAKKAMENLKKSLKNSEPMSIGTVNKETIKDSDYKYVDKNLNTDPRDFINYRGS